MRFRARVPEGDASPGDDASLGDDASAPGESEVDSGAIAESIESESVFPGPSVRPEETGLPLAPDRDPPSDDDAAAVRRRRYATCARISSGWSHHHPAPAPSDTLTPRNPPCLAAAPDVACVPSPPPVPSRPPFCALRTISNAPASAEDLTCASTAESSWTCAAPPPSLQ